MPPGVPVATVAINGAKNAGILAAEIMELRTERCKKVAGYKSNMESEVLAKAKKLEGMGYEQYLKIMSKKPNAYALAGVDVDVEAEASRIMYEASKKTFENRSGKIGEIVTPFDDFAGL